MTGIVATEQSGLASDIGLDPSFTQSYFHDLSEEAGLAISYVQAAPAEPLGFLHFDVGVEASFTQIHSDAAYWQLAYPGTPPSYLPVPKLRARFGLPLSIDVGGSYAYVPGTNVRMAGGEVKWAPFKGGVIMPAVAIRGTYTTLMGVSDLDLQTYGADVSISKGFAIFTPYLGVGQVWIKSKVTSSDPLVIALNIQPETISRTRGFVGLQIGIPFINFAVEAAFSSIPTYTARLSVGF
ncbi:MAG: hypothetical protein HY208_02705 [Nitrospirae bacterium]|nr:hypothetical protein [Nitrospirota bacterium]